MNKRILSLFIILMVGALLIACSSDDAKNNNSGETNSLEGHVSIDGSGTVYPLMAKLGSTQPLQIANIKPSGFIKE